MFAVTVKYVFPSTQTVYVRSGFFFFFFIFFIWIHKLNTQAPADSKPLNRSTVNDKPISKSRVFWKCVCFDWSIRIMDLWSLINNEKQKPKTRTTKMAILVCHSKLSNALFLWISHCEFSVNSYQPIELNQI